MAVQHAVHSFRVGTVPHFHFWPHPVMPPRGYRLRSSNLDSATHRLLDQFWEVRVPLNTTSAVRLGFQGYASAHEHLIHICLAGKGRS